MAKSKAKTFQNLIEEMINAKDYMELNDILYRRMTGVSAIYQHEDGLTREQEEILFKLAGKLQAWNVNQR